MQAYQSTVRPVKLSNPARTYRPMCNAADKLKKGDHLYVVGTLTSNVYEKEVGKGKTKAKAQITAWQIKAFSIRKLDRKESAPTAPATEKTQPEEAPF